ncbi:3-alpha(or 20-beta)-hydroxysteroid dehydrogenase [Rhodotorula toruloides]|uniref:3-alpha(Or 20-beta)-hydroxysteroid dehydrogenase n=1 Tax=Rhodotorula toruloides TaxID=5286 RepID=A0A511KD19_RHOTO|nr:3-alpha(or 20-beta)-hydroxysteroid dehydrogenase [Rhodotorula toruloides]
MTSPHSLEGKVAIVTGGASGIGFATVKAFLAAGALGVTIVDLTSSALSHAVSLLPSSDHSRILTYAGDVSSASTAPAYVAKTVEKWGRVDVSVQCAGISLPSKNVVDMDVDEFDKTISVNLRGVFLGLQESLKAMLASPSGGKGCSVVLVSSQLAFDGYAGSAPYSASKAALRGLMTSVAQEVGPQGIRVNAVAPGPIDTPMLAGFPSEGHTTKGNIKRAGQPEEVANAILYLSSEMGSYCSGTTLKCDDSHHSHIMGKKVAVKLPAANDPDWRKYYAEQNEKLKQSHPGSTGAYRRRVIQRAWRKEHEPANQETASSKKSAQGKKGARKATSDESGSD